MPSLFIDVSDSLSEKLKRFKEDGQLTSDRDLFAHMVALWEWADRRSREGKVIAAIDERTNRFNQISLPPLEWVKNLAMAERELNASSPQRDDSPPPSA